VELARPTGVGDLNRLVHAEALLGIAGDLQQLALLAGRQILGNPGLPENPVSHGVIEIVTAQGGIAACGQHLEHTLGQTQNGDIEGSAAEIVDRDDTLGLTVQTVGDRRCGRLIEQAQHIQAGQPRRILGRLTLGIIEVGRHGDHRPDQLATQRRLGALAQRPQDLRRDFHRALGALDRLDEGHLRFGLTETIGQLFAQLLDVRKPSPHQPLDRADGIERIGSCCTLGTCTDLHTIGVITHNGRQNHLPIGIGQRGGDATAQRGNEGIGSAQVYSDSQAPLMGLRALSGLGNLK